MNIYEILIRGNEKGGFDGGHVIYFGSQLPQTLDLLTGDQVPAWLGDVANLAKNKTIIDSITKENESFKKRLMRLAPDLSGILDKLLEAGLTAWADRASASYNSTHPNPADSLTPKIAQLYSAAALNDVESVLTLFSEVVSRSGVAPSPEESASMQAVLDSVFFPAEVINFQPII